MQRARKVASASDNRLGISCLTSKVETDPTLSEFFEEAGHLGASEGGGGQIGDGVSVKAIVDRPLNILLVIWF
jgi:hypothetical protein